MNHRRATFWVKALVSTALALASSACGGDEGGEGATTSTQAQALGASTQTFTVVMPAASGLDRAALGASTALKIGDRGRVTTATGFAEVTSGGTTMTSLGVEAQTGSVTSVAPMTLADRAVVNGNATSAGTITPGVGAVVTGTKAPNTSVAVDRLTWSVNFPASGPNLDVSSGTTSLAPGARGNVRVFANATLALRAGTYYFDAVTFEPQSKLTLDTQAGSVLVYVRSSLIYRGTTSFTGPNDRLLVGYGGTAAPALDKPLGGTLVAPNASVRLGVGGSPYSGATFAQAIELDPDVRFQHRVFSGWSQLGFDVIPTLSCVEQRADQSFAAVLGYYNPNPNPATIPVGANNGFSPNPQNHGQPTTFLPGRFAGSFSVDFGSVQTLSYKLGATTLSVPRTATRCPTTANANPGEDTTAVRATPLANLGTATRLGVGPGKKAFVRVDRGALKKLVGTGRFVTKASLEMTLATGTKPAAEALVVHRPWTELGATWSCGRDANASATAETCGATDHWQLERDDQSEINPWRRRAPNRRALGVWSGNVLKLDVTRDVQNLMGADGLTRGVSFVVAPQTESASASAEFFSREAGQGPRVVLTLGTLPEAGSARLGAVVDAAVVPNPSQISGFDGTPMNIAAMSDAQGRQSLFVDRELLFSVNDTAELAPVLSRYNGQIVRQFAPPPNLPSLKTLAVVRIDPARAQSDALVPRLLELDNRPRGTHRFSSTSALATMAAAAEEALAGRRVRMNWVSDDDAPTTRDWVNRNLEDGTWEENDLNEVKDILTFNGGAGRNAFSWASFASYEPDPLSQEVPQTNLFKLPDGTPIIQTLGVAEAWRALALMGRLVPASVKVAIVDRSFAAPDSTTFNPVDYPEFITTYDIRETGRKVLHGNRMVHIGYGVPGNGIGAAGPGGPVARLDLLGVPNTFDGNYAGLTAGYLHGARIASFSRHTEVPAIAAPFAGDAGEISEVRAGGMLVIASSGNGEGNDFNAAPIDVDSETCIAGVVCWEDWEFEPCEEDGVTCVTAFEFNSFTRSPSANYGAEAVDLAGPAFALDVKDDRPTNNYMRESATSGATAATSGGMALVLAADPNKSVDEAERCLFATARSSSGMRSANWLAAVRCMATGSATGDLPGQLQIQLPLDNAALAQLRFVSVQATATDPESGELPILWSSDRDGRLAETASGTIGNLVIPSAGTHVLTATATTSTGQVLSDQVTVTVAPVPPTVEIIDPSSDGRVLSSNITTPFVASASGLLGQTAPDSAFSWSSTAEDGSQDFAGVTGRRILPVFTTLGEHVVRVTYTEPGTNAVGSATRIVIVQDTTQLEVQIVNPVLTSTGRAQQEHDKPLTLVAESPTATSYEWFLLRGTQTLSIGGGSTFVWTPSQTTNATCSEQEVVLRVVASDGSGTFADDSIPLLLYPSAEEIAALGCIR